MALIPYFGSYSAASLASAADVPIDFPMPNGTLERIDVYLKEVMDGGDATFNFALNGVDMFSGGDRWIIEDGERHFSKTGIGQAVVIGEYVNPILEEISGGTVVEPILILMWVEDGTSIADEIHAAASKATPVDADEIGIWDSVSTALRKLTWANLKATLKTYFDTLYATPSDVAAAVAGLSWKQSVRVATTANGTLATAFENGDTVDGVVLATGDRILLKDQSAGAENGIYVVAASGAPARAADANSAAEILQASVYVQEGTTNADTQWTCSTNAPITLGSTSLTFAQLTSGGSVSDGDKGDITISGTGTVYTIDNDVVTDAKLRNSAALSVIGRSANSTGDPADIAAGNDAEVLRRSGTSIGFGTVATAGIADDAVTYAKMQNVSATSRILGRKTASAGDPEECTLSEILDFVGSAAQGDIFYRGASGWTRLGAGTNGHYLQTQGAGANPQWAAAAGSSSDVGYFDDGSASSGEGFFVFTQGGAS